MTRFEDVGSQKIKATVTIEACDRVYDHCCEVCCMRGFNIPCERCHIEAAHDEQVSILKLLADCDRRPRYMPVIQQGRPVTITHEVCIIA